MGWFSRRKPDDERFADSLHGVSLAGLLGSCSNRGPRDNAIATAWAQSMPAWCHQAIRMAGGYADTPHTYGHGGLCHNATKEFERALDLAGYKIVPKLTVTDKSAA
jgi:hypothetical protein